MSDYLQIEPWSGLRPATLTSLPILGPTPLGNLLLNVGQGALGFTLAMGSARIIADLATGHAPAIPLDGMTLSGTRGS
jgi:D-amino-acid dehydrogenase